MLCSVRGSGCGVFPLETLGISASGRYRVRPVLLDPLAGFFVVEPPGHGVLHVQFGAGGLPSAGPAAGRRLSSCSIRCRSCCRDRTRVTGTTRISLDAVTLGAAVLGAGVVAGTMALARPVPGDPLYPVIWVALLIVPLRALIHLRNGILVGFDRPGAGLAPTTTLYPGLLLVLVAVVAAIDSSAITATSVAGLAVVATAGAFVWAHLAARRVRPREVQSAAAGPPRLRSWLAASVPMMLITALAIVNLRTDVIMVGLLDDAAAAGVYLVAAQVAFGVRLGMLAAAPAVSSQVAALHEAGDKHELQVAVRTAARIIFGIALVGMALLLVAGRSVLGVFGTDFRHGYAAMAILAVGGTVMMALGPAETVLMMTGSERVAMLAGGIATLANVILNAALISAFGISGAAVATAVSGVTWALILNRVTARRLDVDLEHCPSGGSDRRLRREMYLDAGERPVLSAGLGQTGPPGPRHGVIAAPRSSTGPHLGSAVLGRSLWAMSRTRSSASDRRKRNGSPTDLATAGSL